ncbi:phage antirepressor KilAC domain-containing protein [Haemophilus influenzae]|uniref:phage antirepressor KilAC domain-containing protein n=1 Tax=Haemophilus influenzae TaxID=727 RepID=UPI000CFE41DF|nr:phage regulatory protein/antirepressor Ant [Haemophilus influenzae]MCK8834829.1 phage regulatory protein/antirepressor Ant [Haemophilus influenzae]MCK8836894.1 phage regulatory protein/antirepressor Ant [Haemophilus influenzae]PRI68596.1 Phage antirepressor protein KilAC domain protein [Haemophilus influenzae]PRI72390.1 Phage antirepressor protein KilAC domain protein [Haemophilus influenzae]PRI76547.1 Phage antirepressor protein KilAC domain protein [Haemophilus influenzae]
MNQLLTITKENASILTMNSREIAEITHKEHKNVLRVIRDLIEQNLVAQIEPLKFEYRNQWFDYYELNKRDTFVVARLSPEFTAAVVDRWQALENRQKPTALIPQSFSEALMLAAQLQAEKERNAPKVAFVDHYVEVGTSKSFRETAKILKIPERALVNRLVEDKYLYRQSGVLLPYQSAHTKDLFTVKTGTAEHGHNYTQTRVTSKGIEFIASRYASELML